MSKCEHGLTSAECFVCASPKYAAAPQQQRISPGFIGALERREAQQQAEPVLPYDVTIGGGTFRAGVKLSTFINAARRWHREAFPAVYALTDEQKAHNLAVLQGKAQQQAEPQRSGITTAQVEELKRLHEECWVAAKQTDWLRAEVKKDNLHAALNALVKGE